MEKKKTELMDNVEWHPFFYNGLETNIEVTRCGRVRRVAKDWKKINNKVGEIDFSLLKNNKGYHSIGLTCRTDDSSNKWKTVEVQLIIACVFLNHKIRMYHKLGLVIDHIDSDPTNNHVDNLRLVTNRENSSKEKTIKSGLPVGVALKKINKYGATKYRAEMKIKIKTKWLGLYDSVEEASKVYQDALKALNQFLKDTDNKGNTDEWFESYYEKIKKPKKFGLPKGVKICKSRYKKFISRIMVGYKDVSLGSYETIEDASNAYQEAKRSLKKWISENKNPDDWVILYKKENEH